MKAYSSFELIKILKAHGWYFIRQTETIIIINILLKITKSLSPSQKYPSKTVISILNKQR